MWRRALQEAEKALGSAPDASTIAAASKLLLDRSVELRQRVRLSWPYSGYSVEVAGDVVGGWHVRSPLRQCPSSACSSIELRVSIICCCTCHSFSAEADPNAIFGIVSLPLRMCCFLGGHIADNQCCCTGELTLLHWSCVCLLNKDKVWKEMLSGQTHVSRPSDTHTFGGFRDWSLARTATSSSSMACGWWTWHCQPSATLKATPTMWSTSQTVPRRLCPQQRF